METLSDEARFVLTQLFLDDKYVERTIVHPKKKEKRQGALFKELETLIHDYKEAEIEIDLAPYEEALKFVRTIKGKDAYQEFIHELLSPYYLD